MPSPREVALSTTDKSKLGDEPSDAEKNPPPKEQDYRANPKNPPDGKPPVK